MLLAPEDDVHRLVQMWLATYVTQPHPDLGRSGAVCPFVAQTHAADSITIGAYRFGHVPDLAQMNHAIEQGIVRFRELAAGSVHPIILSLIVTFPDLPPECWDLVDQAHDVCKSRAVEQGLMLGQFHPNCRAPAAHNADFLVNRAPIPLMVIRHMAPHDDLFLEENPVWLEHYRATLAQRRIAGVDEAGDHPHRPIGRSAR